MVDPGISKAETQDFRIDQENPKIFTIISDVIFELTVPKEVIPNS